MRCGSDPHLVPILGFRVLRSILVDIGKAYYQLTVMDKPVPIHRHCGTVHCKVILDEYQQLLDVDWLEDRWQSFGLSYNENHEEKYIKFDGYLHVSIRTGMIP